MSGLVKAVKKVFKKVTKFVKKYWKYIVIAAAVYFTAGVALSYFGSTAGFASNMWGFGTNGVFSKAAVWMGFNGSASVASGLSMTSGAWAGASTAAYGSTLTATELAAAQSAAAGTSAAGTLAPVKVTATKIPAGSSMSIAEASTGGTGITGVTATENAARLAAIAQEGGAATGTLSATDAMAKYMSSAMKMQVASTLLKTAAGFFQPDEMEVMERQHELQWGNAFGVGRSGDTTHGWASSGGSDAFRNMGMPAAAMYGEQQQQQDPGSQYAAKGGQDFLTAPFNYSGTRTMGDQQPQFSGTGQEFIAAQGG